MAAVFATYVIALKNILFVHNTVANKKFGWIFNWINWFAVNILGIRQKQKEARWRRKPAGCVMQPVARALAKSCG